MKLAVELGPYDRMLRADLEGTLDRIVEAGYRNVDLNKSYGASDVDFSQSLARSGLETVSVHVPIHHLRARFGQNIEYAGIFGADWILVPAVQFDEYADGWEKLGAELAEITHGVKESGKHLVYQTGMADFRGDAKTKNLSRLLEGSSSQVDVELDLTAMAKSGDEPGSWFSALSGHLPMVLMDLADDSICQPGSAEHGIWSKARSNFERAGVEWLIVKIRNEQGDWCGNLRKTRDFFVSEGLES